MKRPGEAASRVLWIALFAAAFGFVEAAVVVYLRALYYPEGFSFPLRLFAPSMVPVELVRELATLIMLASVGVLAGRSRWDRFGAFMVAFGVWDITFYLWLKALLAWPASILEWDVLFLLPLPWIGPVLAPVLIALVMTVGGAWMMTVSGRGERFRITPQPVVLALAGTTLLLYSFMHDTGATLHGAMPAPYAYPLLGIGLACYVASFLSLKHLRPSP